MEGERERNKGEGKGEREIALAAGRREISPVWGHHRA